jgi:hypothetical protein
MDNDDKKLEWMYKGKHDVNRDDFLTGKKVDKHFEENELGNCVEFECLPSSIGRISNVGTEKYSQVDILRKEMEDPLMLIKQKEMEARRKILENPLKLKKLNEILKKEKKEPEKSSKKKSKKRTRSSSSSSSSSDSEDLDKLLMEKYKKLQGKSQQQDDDDDEESNYVDRKFKALTTELDKIAKKKKKRSSSSESSSNERNSRQNRMQWSNDRRGMNRNNDYRPKRGNPSEQYIRGRSHDKRYNKYRSRDHSVERKRSISRGRSHEKRFDKNRSRDRSRERKMFSIRGRSHEKRNKKDRSRDYSREHKRSNDKNRSRSREQRVNYRDRSGEDKYRNRNVSRDKDDRYTRQKDRNRNRSAEKSSRNKSRTRSRDRKYRNRSRSVEDLPSKKIDKKMSVSPQKSSKSSSPDIRNPQSSSKQFGLVTASGEKIEMSSKGEVKRYTKEELKPKREAPKKFDKNIKSQLTEEEKEKRYREMLSNADWREKDREQNVKKYNDEVQQEQKTFEKDFDRDFINRNIKHAQAQIGSLESRIKSNVNNIQRSGQSMNQNFAKR